MIKKRFLSMLVLLAAVGTGAWAQEVIPETLDFTSNSWGIPSGSEEKTAAENSYTSGGYTITLCGSSGNGYYFSPTEPYILLGKQGAYLQLPAFSSAVDSIKVVGSPNASTAVEQNIYVGDVAVSTATTGMKNVTQKYVIAENYRTAGTIYRIKVTSAHNTQIKKVLVYFTPASGYSVTMKEGTEDADKWAISPNPAPEGSPVTATYSGMKKVKSVKAVKKAMAPAEGKTYTNLKGGEVLHVGDKITETEGKFRYTHHSNPQSTDYYSYIQSFNTYEVLRADVAYEDYNYKYTESPDGQYYVLKCTYFDDYEEEWFTAYYFNQDLPVTGTSDGITVTLDGQDGSQRNLYTFWVHEPNQ